MLNCAIFFTHKQIQRKFCFPVKQITNVKIPVAPTTFRTFSFVKPQTTEVTKTDLENVPTITKPKNSFVKYLSLAKPRLSSLVVVTAMLGFGMSPDLQWTAETFRLLCCSTVGTALSIASANAINQVFEVDLDSKMSRTVNRVIPAGEVTKAQAITFGILSGSMGFLILLTQVNVLSSLLAASNILLYTLVYTPLKTKTPLNTWVGGIVGAIPPLIGWASATGGISLGAWVLFYLLYIWQIPHFLALSWPLRKDYERAGYKMLSVTHPDKVPTLCFRYSLYFIPFGFACVFTDITHWIFIFDSNLVNAYLIWKAWEFKKDNSNVNARNCFKATLYYLPLMMILLIIHKKRKVNKKEVDPNESLVKEI